MNIEEMWMNLIDMSRKVKRRTPAFTQVSRTYSDEGDGAEREYVQAMEHMKEILEHEGKRNQSVDYQICRWPARELLGHLRAGKAGG